MNYRYSNKEVFSWALGQLFEHLGLWLSIVGMRLFPLIGLLFALAIPLLLPVHAISSWSPFAGQWSPAVVGSLMSWMTPSGIVLAVVLLAAFSFLFASIWVAGSAVALAVYDQGRSNLRRFWVYFFAYSLRAWFLLLVQGGLIILGLICFIVPGVYIALALQFAPFVLADTGCSFWSAIRASWRMTHGYMVQLFVTNLALYLIAIVLWQSFWLFVFVYPLTLLVRTYMYRVLALKQMTIAEVHVVASVI